MSFYIFLQYLVAGLSLRATTHNTCYAECVWLSLDTMEELPIVERIPLKVQKRTRVRVTQLNDSPVLGCTVSQAALQGFRYHFLNWKQCLKYLFLFVFLTCCFRYCLLGKVLLHGNAGISRRLVSSSSKQWFLLFVSCLLLTSELIYVCCVSFPSAALMIAFIMETYGLTYR